MAAIAFWGYLFLGLGPATVFFAFFVATKSFLVLLALFSAFYWLTVLLLTSSIYRGFLPIDETVGSYVGAVAGAVFIQELARYGVWRIQRYSVAALEAMSRRLRRSFGPLDTLYLSLAWGYGHAACQATFLFIYLVPLTAGDGTYYLPSCPHMSLFLVNALYSNAFFMLLTSAMVVSLDGYHAGSWLHVLYAPVLHMAAGIATVANFRQDACLYIIPSLLGLGLLSTAYASALAWRKGARRLRSPSQSLIGSNGGAASAAAPPPSSTGLQTLQPRGSGRRAN